MNGRIRYKQCGNCDREAPLEAFYDALLPHLKAYGIAAEFPTDYPSTETYTAGIKFDIRIGEPPHAIRYDREQESLYGNGADFKRLEAVALSQLETGEELSLKIGIDNYHPPGFKLTVEFEGERAQVEAMQNAVEPVLARYKFNSVELEIKPLDKESQADDNAAETARASTANQSPSANNSPKTPATDYQTKTVVAERPARGTGFNLLMGAALLLIGIPAAVQFYSRLRYDGFPVKQKIFWGALSLIFIGAAAWSFVRAAKIYIQDERNKPQYEPIDPQTIPKPAKRVEVRAHLVPAVALAFLIVFFGGTSLIALSASSIGLTNLVVTAFSLSIIFVNSALFFRARRKSARAFDASGIERGDGRQFSWAEFRGTIIRTGNTRYGLKGVWRTELAFAGGEEAWLIANRIKNYDDVYALVNKLPRAVLKDP